MQVYQSSQCRSSHSQHDPRSEGQSHPSKQTEVIQDNSNEPASRSAIGIPDRVDDPPNEMHQSKHGRCNGEVYSRDEQHNEHGGSKLYEVVMHPLCVVKLVPLLVGQLGRVASTAHIRIPTHCYLVSSGDTVLLAEVGSQILFVEDHVAGFLGDCEADCQDLEGEGSGNDEDVAVVSCDWDGECGRCCQMVNVHAQIRIITIKLYWKLLNLLESTYLLSKNPSFLYTLLDLS